MIDKCEWVSSHRGRELLQSNKSNYELRMLLLGFRPEGSVNNTNYIKFETYTKDELGQMIIENQFKIRAAHDAVLQKNY